MIDTPIIGRENLSEQPIQTNRNSRTALWQRLALLGVMLVSIFMNFYQLGQNGFGNSYYASAVRSMLDSWHAFFFVSFDPVGFVSVDKPPLGFWLQVVSAKVLGFTPFSVFFPQALAGVLSVLLLYYLVRRHFGVVAGLLAALALAVSPISVVTNRNNTIDSTLVLTMLLGAWTVMKAAESGKWRWLMLTAVLVGLGFNIKMLEAYLVVPAYALLYLLAAPRSLKMRIVQLLVAALVMLSISLSWAIVVDLTPVSQRPYVGSSQDNSELSLALGYNGIQRLLGSFGFDGGNTSNNSGTPSGLGLGNYPQPGLNNGQLPQPPQRAPSGNGSQLPPSFPGGNGGQPPQPPQGAPGGNGSGMFNTGTPGLLRLFNEPLGGQIVWLLPLAMPGILALAWQRRPYFREDRQQQSLVLWGIWLLTMGIFFSVANFFHQYYLSTFAPAICAMFGIGVVVMWNDFKRSGWRGWLLPVALLLTGLEQVHIIMSNTAWGTWLIPVIALGSTVATLVLFIARLLPRLKQNTRILVPALCIGLLVLMLTPAIWSAVPGLQNSADGLPIAGPSQQLAAGGPAGNPGGEGSVSSSLIHYLEANQGSAKYLVAVPSSNQADAIILATNKGVMALGGFSGSDPILTTSQLASLVADGTVRYFLLNGAGGFGGGPGGGQSSLTTWVTQHCTTVPTNQWQSASDRTVSSGLMQLYSCATAK